MVNFKVIRIGDIVKNLVKVGILILCFILFTREGVKKCRQLKIVSVS